MLELPEITRKVLIPSRPIISSSLQLNIILITFIYSQAASNNTNETIQTSSKACIQPINKPTCPTSNKHASKSNESQHTKKSTENDKLKEKVLTLSAELEKQSEKVETLMQRNYELQDIIINKFKQIMGIIL